MGTSTEPPSTLYISHSYSVRTQSMSPEHIQLQPEYPGTETQGYQIAEIFPNPVTLYRQAELALCRSRMFNNLPFSTRSRSLISLPTFHVCLQSRLMPSVISSKHCGKLNLHLHRPSASKNHTGQGPGFSTEYTHARRVLLPALYISRGPVRSDPTGLAWPGLGAFLGSLVLFAV